LEIQHEVSTYTAPCLIRKTKLASLCSEQYHEDNEVDWNSHPRCDEQEVEGSVGEASRVLQSDLHFSDNYSRRMWMSSWYSEDNSFSRRGV